MCGRVVCIDGIVDKKNSKKIPGKNKRNRKKINDEFFFRIKKSEIKGNSSSSD